jgi:hypothetical protein
LLSVILQLRLERRNARIPGAQRHAITLQHSQGREQVIARIRERTLAFACRRLKLFLAERERVGTHVILDADLIQALPGRIVIAFGNLTG